MLRGGGLPLERSVLRGGGLPLERSVLRGGGLPLERSVLRGGGVCSPAVTLCPLDVWHLSVRIPTPVPVTLVLLLLRLLLLLLPLPLLSIREDVLSQSCGSISRQMLLLLLLGLLLLLLLHGHFPGMFLRVATNGVSRNMVGKACRSMSNLWPLLTASVGGGTANACP